MLNPEDYIDKKPQQMTISDHIRLREQLIIDTKKELIELKKIRTLTQKHRPVYSWLIG